MRRSLSRDARMLDMQIMAALQNGIAFFASPTLLAVGGVVIVMWRSAVRLVGTARPYDRAAGRSRNGEVTAPETAPSSAP